MHPVYAAKTCDPEGEYVRRWIPELKDLPVEFIHCPWEAPGSILSLKHVSLGSTYPNRVLKDLDQARLRSHRAVINVRKSREGRKYILADGNEFIFLHDGRRARCITRKDFRHDESSPVTYQTAGEKWDAKTRAPRNPLKAALRDVAKIYARKEKVLMCDVRVG